MMYCIYICCLSVTSFAMVCLIDNVQVKIHIQGPFDGLFIDDDDHNT